MLKLAFRWLTPSNQSIYSQHCPSSSFLMSHFSSKVVIDLDMCYWFPLTRVYCVLGGYNHSFGKTNIKKNTLWKYIKYLSKWKLKEEYVFMTITLTYLLQKKYGSLCWHNKTLYDAIYHQLFPFCLDFYNIIILMKICLFYISEI